MVGLTGIKSKLVDEGGEEDAKGSEGRAGGSDDVVHHPHLGILEGLQDLPELDAAVRNILGFGDLSATTTGGAGSRG